MCIVCHCQPRQPDSLRCADCGYAKHGRKAGQPMTGHAERRRIIDQIRRAVADAREMADQHPGLDDPNLAERASLDEQLDREQQRFDELFGSDSLRAMWFDND
jgi:hypothetical protein